MVYCFSWWSIQNPIFVYIQTNYILFPTSKTIYLKFCAFIRRRRRQPTKKNNLYFYGLRWRIDVQFFFLGLQSVINHEWKLDFGYIVLCSIIWCLFSVYTLFFVAEGLVRCNRFIYFIFLIREGISVSVKL